MAIHTPEKSGCAALSLLSLAAWALGDAANDNSNAAGNTKVASISVIGFFCVARRCMEPLCLLLMVFVRPLLPLAQRT
jgi:hypothetical protein